MYQPTKNSKRLKILLGMSTYALLPKVLSTPISGTSPEKKLVDKFLRQAGSTYIKYKSYIFQYHYAQSYRLNR